MKEEKDAFNPENREWRKRNLPATLNKEALEVMKYHGIYDRGQYVQQAIAHFNNTYHPKRNEPKES